jgi:hypothetical protein
MSEHFRFSRPDVRPYDMFMLVLCLWAVVRGGRVVVPFPAAQEADVDLAEIKQLLIELRNRERPQ